MGWTEPARVRRAAGPSAALPRLRLLAAVLGLVALVGTGCSPDKPPSSHPSHSSPSPEQIDELRARIAAIPGVTQAELHFSPGNKLESGPYWSARVTAPGVDRPGLVRILDQSYRTVWQDADVPFGQLEAVVTDGAGSGVDYLDLGTEAPQTYEEMEQRYGPRPGHSPQKVTS